MKIKNPFYMQKNDRQALIVLLAIIIVCFSLAFVIGRKDESQSPNKQVSIKQASKEHPVYYKEEGMVHELFPFDPNTANADELERLGLEPWQAKSIIRFREKGGIFSRPSDFARVYGITKKTYETLLPFVHIADDYKPASEFYGHEPRKRATPYYNSTNFYGKDRQNEGRYEVRKAYEERKAYEVRKGYEEKGEKNKEGEKNENEYKNLSKYNRPQKMKPGEHVAINTADTTELMKVPGIGSYYAKAIVKYRKQLGGFVHIEQLAEIKDFPSSAIDFIEIDAAQISQININKLSFAQLCRHPYINTTQAKKIRDYRNKKGPLKNLNELKLLNGFSTDEIERLKPYVTF